jgi:hypothetical protein
VPLAYATNESSYQSGYKNAIQVSSCIATQIRTDSGDDCSRGTVSYYWGCGVDNPSDTGNISAVTNKTACNDGFINGFVHWCGTDQKGCAVVLKAGIDVNNTVYDQQQKLDAMSR